MAVLADGGTLDRPEDDYFVGFNTTTLMAVCGDPVDIQRTDSDGKAVIIPRAGVASWCEQCINPIDNIVITITIIDHMSANVAAMGSFDWIALCLSTSVVAFKVVGELKDTAVRNRQRPRGRPADERGVAAGALAPRGRPPLAVSARSGCHHTNPRDHEWR